MEHPTLAFPGPLLPPSAFSLLLNWWGLSGSGAFAPVFAGGLNGVRDLSLVLVALWSKIHTM